MISISLFETSARLSEHRRDATMTADHDALAAPRITADWLRRHCRTHKQYLTPALNDTLHLHLQARVSSGPRCTFTVCARFLTPFTGLRAAGVSGGVHGAKERVPGGKRAGVAAGTGGASARPSVRPPASRPSPPLCCGWPRLPQWARSTSALNALRAEERADSERARLPPVCAASLPPRTASPASSRTWPTFQSWIRWT